MDHIETDKDIAARASYWYLIKGYMLKKSREQLLSDITKSAKYSYIYSLEVVKGRYPEGEPAIYKNLYFAALYHLDVLKTKLPDHLHRQVILDSFRDNHEIYRDYLSKYR
jgi:hypothetical protein